MVSTEPAAVAATQSWTFVPGVLRTLVRRSELGLIALAIVVGTVAGAFVAFISWMASVFHLLLFGIPLEERLSASAVLATPGMALIPAAGGLLLAVVGLLIKRYRPRRPVDPIEANALQGGRMSIIDSVLITIQTMMSNGCGGSVGLEAGYTQIGSGLASRLGIAFRLRRSDLRTLVACGSAGAIGAAFGAPLTGAFYAFELVLGSYTPFGLAPIGAASIAGVLTARIFGTVQGFAGEVASSAHVTETNMAVLLLLGIVCAGAGIGIMRAVALVESLFSRSPIPVLLQPAIGGLVVGAFALITPQVLASGHGALSLLLHSNSATIGMLMTVFFLKSLSAALSIGSGYRGGLFFASLFLGALVGKIYALGLGLVAPAFAPDAAICAVVGMAALAVAIVGGPLTMSFLALETTGDFPLSIMLLATAAIVSVVVRQTFGYSFATWRLHLRGESIRSAQDVGWMRAQTVVRLMRKDIKTAPVDTAIEDFRHDFPIGSMQWTVAADAAGRYAGMISVPEAHLDTFDGETRLDKLLRHPDVFMLPFMNIKEAADVFERTESEALAVVDTRIDRKVVGLLTEAHVLRRYTEELDKARRDLAGETWLRE